ncbi:FG-GAP-like repeat-containing protein [Chryseolinea sp. T2]|uniref:FG-GAP-like repeat-containing protein n=1 Tax=Chryseolinea sp. T2 TaxID=3129255 RepID=UPI003078601C
MPKLYFAVALLSCAFPLLSPAQSFQEFSAGLDPLYDGRISWSDLDNDGDLDLIYSGQANENTFRTRVYENNTGAFVLRATALPDLRNGEIALGDFDKDGDPDVLLSGRGVAANISELYLNNGSFSFSLQTSFAGLMNSGASFADIDNDEDPDIIITGTDDSTLPVADKVLVYRNDGPSFTQLTTTSLPGCSNCAIDWADVNHDGFVDAAIASVGRSNSSHTELYINNGNSTFTLDNSQSLPEIKNGDLHWGDFDRDGQMDLLVGGVRSDGTITTDVFQNNGGKLKWMDELNLYYVALNRHGGTQWADYNNDGLLDIVLSGQGTSVVDDEYILKGFLNQGDSTFTEEDLVPEGLSYSSIDFGDFDNDGDLDIAYMGRRSTGVVTGILRNTLRNAAFAVNTKPTAPLLAGLSEKFYRKSVKLKWPGGSDVQTPTAALSYNFWLQRGAVKVVVPGANPSTGYITTSNPPNGHSQKIELSNLPEGNYTWAVQAIDGTGTGSLFTAAKAFHQLNGPEALKAEIVDETHVKLTWLDHSGIETSYRIERSLSPNTGFATRATPAANTTTYSDNFAFVAETPYYYRIYAVDATKSSGYDSLKVVLPAKPANVGALEIHAARMIITWDDNSNVETAYTIERKLASASTFDVLDTLDADDTEYYDNNLTEGTAYVYRVRAMNENGYSAYSDAATITSNFRPRGADIAKTGVEDHEVKFTEQDFADQFTDQDVDDMFVSIYVSALPQRGALKLGTASVTAGQRIARSALSTLLYIPAKDDNGLHPFSFYFSDGRDSSDVVYQAKVNLTPVNDAPVFTIPLKLTLDEDFEVQSIVPVISIPADEQSQTITWTLTPAEVTNITVELDQATGTIKLTPVKDASGTWQFTLTADDGQATDSKHTASIEIVVRSVNDAPFIGEIEDISVEKTQPIPPVTLSISDPDSPAESIILGVTSDNQSVVKNSNLRIEGNTLTIVPELKVGKAVITVRATDGISVGTRQFTVDITVITAIEKIAHGVDVYPNPVQSALNINVDENFTLPFKVLLQDVMGKEVLNMVIESASTQLDFSEIKAGLYFLKVVTPEDKVLYEGRIIKN